jgi:GT2 family glycosyltransferase/SAM-dependent methyltransferase
MAFDFSSNDLRSFSDDQHQKQVWGSSVYSVPSPLRCLVNLFSFKHSGIERLAQRCNNRSRVLDFGAGNCNFSIYLATKRTCTIVAADWSFDALRNAQHKFSHLRVLPVCADLHALPFKESSFSGFFTIDTFGHLSNPTVALDGLHRVLKPGATGFFHSECADYKSRWPDSMLIARNGRDIPAESDGHVSLLDSKTIISLLKMTFNLISSFSPAGYLGWLTGYPEKYTNAFAHAGNMFLYKLTKITTHIKKSLPGKLLLRIINYLTNRLELSLNMQGGGSFFTDVIKPVQDKHNGSFSIDIIIPTYKRNAYLPDLINRLLDQCNENDTIVIISQDETLHLPNKSRRLHVLYNYPPNLPDARNKGIASGTNDIILFLDDDTIPSENLLEKHRLVYRDDGINCIAGSVDDPRFMPSNKSPSLFDIKSGRLIQNFLFPNASQSISFMGAHFSLRRSILKNIGTFDCAFKGNAYWEDIDFSFRLQRSGYDIHYKPDIRITHLIGSDGGCRKANKSAFCYDYFANSMYFALKYMPFQYVNSWITYWKYRLEYETRAESQHSFFKHNSVLIASSVWGMAAAVFRFLYKGKRIGVPETVIHQNRMEST